MFRRNERIFHESLITELMTLVYLLCVCLILCLLATVQSCLVACLEFEKDVCLFLVVLQSSLLSGQGMCMSDLVQYLGDDLHGLPKWKFQNLIRFIQPEGIPETI